jgi:hypothetical protein
LVLVVQVVVATILETLVPTAHLNITQRLAIAELRPLKLYTEVAVVVEVLVVQVVVVVTVVVAVLLAEP